MNNIEKKVEMKPPKTIPNQYELTLNTQQQKKKSLVKKSLLKPDENEGNVKKFSQLTKSNIK